MLVWLKRKAFAIGMVYLYSINLFLDLIKFITLKQTKRIINYYSIALESLVHE